MGHIEHYDESDNRTGNVTFVAVDPFSTHQIKYNDHNHTYSEYTTFEGNNEIQIKNIEELKEPPVDEINKLQKKKSVHI